MFNKVNTLACQCINTLKDLFLSIKGMVAFFFPEGRVFYEAPYLNYLVLWLIVYWIFKEESLPPM